MARKREQIRTGIQEVDPRHQLDVARLEEYVRANLDEFDGTLAVRQFVGGQSNPTYLVSDGTREWVLRRKPPGKLVSSAHATDREFRILAALGQTDFPVPRVRVYCGDQSVIGTEFYLMDRVIGRILVDQTLPDWKAEERRSLYESQIEILARLHQIDHEAIGLGDYGKPGNYFARQIHVWSKQYLSSLPGEISPGSAKSPVNSVGLQPSYLAGYAETPLVCLRYLATITEPSVARRILECLGLSPRAPPITSASTPGWIPDPWLEPPAAADFDQTPTEDWDTGA